MVGFLVREVADTEGEGAARDSVYEAGSLGLRDAGGASRNLWTTPIFSAVVIHRCRIG